MASTQPPDIQFSQHGTFHDALLMSHAPLDEDDSLMAMIESAQQQEDLMAVVDSTQLDGLDHFMSETESTQQLDRFMAALESTQHFDHFMNEVESLDQHESMGHFDPIHFAVDSIQLDDVLLDSTETQEQLLNEGLNELMLDIDSLQHMDQGMADHAPVPMQVEVTVEVEQTPVDKATTVDIEFSDEEDIIVDVETVPPELELNVNSSAVLNRPRSSLTGSDKSVKQIRQNENIRKSVKKVKPNPKSSSQNDNKTEESLKKSLNHPRNRNPLIDVTHNKPSTSTVVTPSASQNVVRETLKILDPSKLSYIQPQNPYNLTTKSLKPRSRSVSMVNLSIDPKVSAPTAKGDVDMKTKLEHIDRNSQTKMFDMKSNHGNVDMKPTTGKVDMKSTSGKVEVKTTSDVVHPRGMGMSRRARLPLNNGAPSFITKTSTTSFATSTLEMDAKKLLNTVSVKPSGKDKPSSKIEAIGYTSSSQDRSGTYTSSSWSDHPVLHSSDVLECDTIRNMEDLSCNFKWLFSEEKLRNTPSVESGISMEQELTFRQKQAMLIQTIGLKSGLTQLAVNTSVIFMHRFYMFRTVKAFPRVQLALGFAFAGGKVEESARKLEHLIRTSIDIIRSNKNREFLDKSDPFTYEMDSQWRSKMDVLCQNNCNIESSAYQEMRKLVLECETEIYAVIGFQLQIVHPHNYVIRMCALLGDGYLSISAENIKDISQYAYNLATASSQLTMLCLKYKPETIATMCLNIASKAHSVKFVSMKDPNVKWYQVLHSQTDLTEIEAVSEEFLQLIKGCPLLPSWMTNLGRMSRVANSRAMPGPSRGPGASSASAPQGSRQGQVQSSSNTTSTAGSVLHSLAVPSNLPTRPVQQMGLSNSLSQNIETQQLVNSGSVHDSLHSPNSKQPAAGEGVLISGSAPSDVISRTHSSGGNSQMRPPSGSSATATNPHHSQQQHRSHAPINNNGRQPNSSSAPANSKPQSRHSLPSSSNQPPGTSRSASQHSGPPATHLSSHTSSSRQSHDPARLSLDSIKPHDPLRSQDSQRINHDPARTRDPSRSQDPTRPTQRTDRRSEPGFDSKKSKSHPTTREEASALRHQQARSAAEYLHAQDLNTSPHTPPPPCSPAVKVPSPVDPASELAYTVTASGDVPDYIRGTTSPDPTVKADDGQPLAVNQVHAPKLSLSMYRERASARSKVPTGSYEQNTPGEDNTAAIMGDDILPFEPVCESAMNSPVDKGLKQNTSNSDLANFNTPQTDSPNAPPLKIKVKLDPSGDRHYVKNTDSGLRLKIKKNRDVEAGPSSTRSASRSNTPFEEGEIVDDSSPVTVPGGSERKAEGLKIRLSVPRSGDTSGGYSRRDSDHSSNGYNGERESHRSHRHSHHHRSYHSKSKKHSSKHDRSRHEGKSSKRSSAADYHEERPSKSLRLESYSSETTHRSIHSDNSSSQTLQHQNSGFSINDAFSSTMPHNIFEDDEDDGSHAPPPITPTTDAVPAHHEKFHQMLARHRALRESSKPPLPKGQPPPPSPPPPPPSPPTL